MKKAVLFVVVCLAPTLGQARIITVDDDAPADFNNIQAAIDDANNGDTVEIQPGTRRCLRCRGNHGMIIYKPVSKKSRAVQAG